MPFLLKTWKIVMPKHRVKGENTRLPRAGSKKSRTYELIQFILSKLEFTQHAREKIEARYNKKVIKYDVLKKYIAKRWNSSTLDTTTGNLKITYKGRRVVNNDGAIITYMQPKNNTDREVLKNHKLIHKYKQMRLEDLEKYRYK